MNIYCFSTLSFAKLQFKSVINKAFHKHGVASFTDAWIETLLSKPTPPTQSSHLLQMRGLKQCISVHRVRYIPVASFTDAWIETQFVPPKKQETTVASFTDAWIETDCFTTADPSLASHLLQMRGLKPNVSNVVLNPASRIFYRCVD